MTSNDPMRQQTRATFPRVKLPYSIIKVEGPDAEKFLQGQVSCDLAKLDTHAWCYGTANTPKGRLYWLFAIAKMSDHFLIRVHNEIVKQGLTTLSKYKVFFKCDIHILDTFNVYGETAQEAEQPPALLSAATNTLEECGEGLRKKATPASLNADTRTELWTEKDLPSSHEKEATEAWFARDCEAGVPELYPNTLDTFILQQLNLQELGAVSFNKGCYTGQEIIARMKFLGKLKKKMYLFTVPLSDRIAGAAPGDPLVDETGRKIGQLVRLHSDQGKVHALAVCDIAAIESGLEKRLSVGAESTHAEGQSLQFSELHYD